MYLHCKEWERSEDLLVFLHIFVGSFVDSFQLVLFVGYPRARSIIFARNLWQTWSKQAENHKSYMARFFLFFGVFWAESYKRFSVLQNFQDQTFRRPRKIQCWILLFCSTSTGLQWELPDWPSGCRRVKLAPSFPSPLYIDTCFEFDHGG